MHKRLVVTLQLVSSDSKPDKFKSVRVGRGDRILQSTIISCPADQSVVLLKGDIESWLYNCLRDGAEIVALAGASK
jgi:hypothetical protein